MASGSSQFPTLEVGDSRGCKMAMKDKMTFQLFK